MNYIQYFALLLSVLIIKAWSDEPESDYSNTFSFNNETQQFDKLIDQSFSLPADSALYIYRKAGIFIDSLLLLYPENSDILARAAIAQVQLLGYDDTMQKINRVQKIDSLSRLAILKDSTNSVALVIQGIMNYRLSNLSWIERFIADTFIGSLPEASYSRSIIFIQKAIQYHNSSPYYHFALGRTFLAIDKKDKTLKHLQIAVNTPAENKLDQHFQKLAQSWIDNLAKGIKFDLHQE